MPDPGLPPPTHPAQIVLDRWLHDFWKWVRGFVKSVRAADNSIVVTTDSDNNVTLRVPASGAPVDATYATVTDESAVLINSRRLAAGANITLTDNGAGSTLVIAASGAALEVQDEGAPVDSDVTTLNFIGAGVTATQTSPGVVEVAVPGGGSGAANPATNDFRLTLTSGVPVTTSDVSGASTIYCCPYVGNQIALYDGASWNVRSSAQFSLGLGTLTAALPYDVFCHDNATVPTLEFLAWTNTTTRATALAYQDGVLVKSGDATRRYLGTFYTTSTTTTEDSAGGVSSQVGGKRFLWNYYHRVQRNLKVIDTTDSWTYSNTATWRRANGAAGNIVEFVMGVVEDAADATLVAALTAGSSGAGNSQSGIGLNSATAPGSFIAGTYGGSLNTQTVRRLDFPATGYNYFSWLERATQSGGTTWYGDGGSNPFQSGLTAVVKA